jgi:hypothetical protein
MTSFLLAVALAAAINPTGHWEGAVDTPQGSVTFEVDLATINGALGGAITVRSQHVSGLPLTKVVVDGWSITFGARSDQLLAATIAEDGKTMSGTFTMDAYSFPFTLTRIGEARIEPLPTSAPIAKELEGTWNGTLTGAAAEIHLVLTMSNEPDGMARATMVNVDEGGLRLPMRITQHASTISLTTSVVDGSFEGELSAKGELVGTYRQSGMAVPLTFHRGR